MNGILIKIEPNEILHCLIMSYRDDISKKSNPDRYTKFDSDNDSFLGRIGEIAFKRYLLSRGFLYGTNFYDHANLPNDAFYVNETMKYDKYDFGVKLGSSEMKIDVKTQYAVNINYLTDSWQIAVNQNTIEKINNGNRNIDFFVFIFSDKTTKIYRDYIAQKLEQNNIEVTAENAIYFLEHRASFSPIWVKIVGAIKANMVAAIGTSFKKNTIFRINPQKPKPFIFYAQDDMYRVYIQYLKDINRLIPPLKFTTNRHLSDNQYVEFKTWLEGLYKQTGNFISISIDEKITVDITLNDVIENMQYENYDKFLKSMLNIFL